MFVAALLIPLALIEPIPAQEPPHAEPAQHVHLDDFESMLEHRAFPELMQWRERHPWRVGTEVRKFVLRLETERARGDPEVDRVWDTHAAFLAEAFADDVCTEWLITVLRFDVETRARFDTVRAGLADIAESIPKKGAAHVLEEIDGLRSPIAPAWAFESCMADLVRIAEAARASGSREAALAIAREVATMADRTHDGDMAIWSTAVLWRAALESKSSDEAEQGFEKLIQLAGDVENLPASLDAILDDKTLELVHATKSEAFAGGAFDNPMARQYRDRVEASLEAFRARMAEQRGSTEEALEHWRKSCIAMDSCLAFHMVPKPWLEPYLVSPGPARRGTLAAARLGRVEEAWAFSEESRSRRWWLQRNPFDPAGTKARLAERGLDSVVEYVVCETETVALTIGADGIRARVLPVGREQLQALVESVLDPIRLLEKRKIELDKLTFDDGAARALYAAIVQPVVSSLGSHAAIAPDAPLDGLPFGLLVSGGEAGTFDPARPFAHLEGLHFLVDDRALAEIRSTLVLSETPQEFVTWRWQPVGSTMTLWSAGLEARKAAGEKTIDAVRAEQLEIRKSVDPAGFDRIHPWFWAAWYYRIGG